MQATAVWSAASSRTLPSNHTFPLHLLSCSTKLLRRHHLFLFRRKSCAFFQPCLHISSSTLLFPYCRSLTFRIFTSVATVSETIGGSQRYATDINPRNARLLAQALPGATSSHILNNTSSIHNIDRCIMFLLRNKRRFGQSDLQPLCFPRLPILIKPNLDETSAFQQCRFPKPSAWSGNFAIFQHLRLRQ